MAKKLLFNLKKALLLVLYGCYTQMTWASSGPFISGKAATPPPTCGVYIHIDSVSTLINYGPYCTQPGVHFRSGTTSGFTGTLSVALQKNRQLYRADGTPVYPNGNWIDYSYANTSYASLTANYGYSDGLYPAYLPIYADPREPGVHIAGEYRIIITEPGGCADTGAFTIVDPTSTLSVSLDRIVRPGGGAPRCSATGFFNIQNNGNCSTYNLYLRSNDYTPWGIYPLPSIPIYGLNSFSIPNLLAGQYKLVLHTGPDQEWRNLPDPITNDPVYLSTADTLFFSIVDPPCDASLQIDNVTDASSLIASDGSVTFEFLGHYCIEGQVTVEKETIYPDGFSWSEVFHVTNSNLLSLNPADRVSSASNLSPGSYRLRIVNNLGDCTDQKYFTISAPMPSPIIDLSGPATFCDGGSVTLSAPQGFDSYFWSTGETTQQISVKTGGKYSVKVVSGNQVSPPSDSVVVTVNPVPFKPTITANGPTTFCDGGNVVLGDFKDLNSNYSFVWSSGETKPVISVSKGGNYTLQTVAAGCSSAVSDPILVSVNPIPAAPAISPSGPLTICQYAGVVLSAPAGFGYLWSTGESTQSITASKAGSYTVQVVANGCTSAVSLGVVVSVNPAPAPLTVTASGATTFCAGGSVTLSAPTGKVYLWSTGATTRTISVKTSGSYTVQAIAAGCTSLASVPVVVTANPIPTTPVITPNGPTTFCAGGSVVLSAPAGFGYLWNTGVTTQSVTASTTSSFTVKTIALGCTSATSAAKAVTVNPIPATPVLTPVGSNTICQGGSLVVSAPTGFTYLWNTGSTARTLTVTKTGSYQVQTISKACTSAASLPSSVTVNPSPTVTTSGKTALCSGQSVTLTSSASGGNLWSNGATTSSIVVKAAGSYSVKQIFPTCTTSSSAAVPVALVSTKAPTISGGTNTTVCNGTTVTLTSSATAGNVWSTGATTQSIVVATSGNYSVQQVGAGCASPVSLQVYIPGCNGRAGFEDIDGVKASKVSLYPNPVVNGLLNVSSQSVIQTIKIYSITGVKLYDATLNATYSELAIPLKAGTYVVEAQTETGTERKLIHWE